MIQKQDNTNDEWQPRIVAFLCNWCSYAGADLAGMSRLGYPAAIKAIRVPCSGRVDPMFILKSFERGADMDILSMFYQYRWGSGS
jgi:F420-non-reducing hydrogenase iron-sulfur subunit